MTKLVLTMALACLLVGTVGFPAAAQQSNPDDTFATLDANGDGKLSSAEFAPLAPPNSTEEQKKEMFSSWDSDGDNYISKEEFKAKYSGGR